jgi:hypothetical protein
MGNWSYSNEAEKNKDGLPQGDDGLVVSSICNYNAHPPQTLIISHDLPVSRS